MSRVGIFVGEKEIVKRYVGDRLVWEKKEKEESYGEIYTSHLTQATGPSDRFFVIARNGQKVINIDDIVKVVVGGEVTIPRNKIRSIDNKETHRMYLTSSVSSALGYSGTFYVFESVEIYLK